MGHRRRRAYVLPPLLAARADACAGVWVINGHDSVTKGVIVCSYLFVCSFAITMGPVSWTYPAEIFPMRVRAKAVSVSTAVNWLFNFALAWAVPPGLSSIAYKTYFIFGAFNFAAFVHIFFCFPETAGRTLEEIEDVFAQGHVLSAWRVDRRVGQKTLAEVVHKAQVESVRVSRGAGVPVRLADVRCFFSFFFFGCSTTTTTARRRRRRREARAAPPAAPWCGRSGVVCLGPFRVSFSSCITS